MGVNRSVEEDTLSCDDAAGGDHGLQDAPDRRPGRVARRAAAEGGRATRHPLSAREGEGCSLRDGEVETMLGDFVSTPNVEPWCRALAQAVSLFLATDQAQRRSIINNPCAAGAEPRWSINSEQKP